MNYRAMSVCVFVALAVAMASAQTKTTMSGKCGKADVEHSLPAGDQQGRTFTLSQGKCTVTGDVGGVAGKQGTFTEHAEITGNHFRNWGVYVVAFDNGDKIFYDYQSVGTMKDGAFQSATNKYQISGGTGKMKGIKGSGTCKLTGNSDGSTDYSCSGDSTLAGGAAK
jgi:hypothetical protein